MKAAVIGSPISHSLSPAIFEFLSKEKGIDIEYTSREVKAEEVSSFLQTARKTSDYVGFNVTLPLKELVQSELSDFSIEAKTIGSVNVIHYNSEDAKGYNTDINGIEKTLGRAGFSIQGKSCLIWGAGGSAKTIAYVLGKHRARKVYIFNRSDRGQLLVQNLSKLFTETSFEYVPDLSLVTDVAFSLIVNTTPLGMSHHESGKEYFEQARKLKFTKSALAFDLIYTPEETDFLKTAASLGLNPVGGLGMLIGQALATWKIWIGPLEDEDDMFKKLSLYLRGILKLRADPKPVYLTGFMGVGKSTVGKELARMTRRNIFETDKMIEEKSQKSIPEIFKEYGEEGFRKLEKDSVAEVSQLNDSIVSLGGGALIDPDNRSKIKSGGTLIYLQADEATLASRLKEQNVSRPLLEGLQDDEYLNKITSMLEDRRKVYEEATFTIPTVGLDPVQVCFEILSKIGEEK